MSHVVDPKTKEALREGDQFAMPDGRTLQLVGVDGDVVCVKWPGEAACWYTDPRDVGLQLVKGVLVHTLVLLDLEDRSVPYVGSGVTFEAALTSLNADMEEAYAEAVADDPEDAGEFQPLEATPEDNFSHRLVGGTPMMLQWLTVDVEGVRRDS